MREILGVDAVEQAGHTRISLVRWSSGNMALRSLVSTAQGVAVRFGDIQALSLSVGLPRLCGGVAGVHSRLLRSPLSKFGGLLAMLNTRTNGATTPTRDPNQIDRGAGGPVAVTAQNQDHAGLGDAKPAAGAAQNHA